MGLNERRAIQNFQEKRFPELKKQIEEAAGFSVPVEVKWETLSVDDYASEYDNFFTAVYFRPLIEALTAVGADKMGKDAIKEGLKKICITNEAGNHYPETAVSFENGMLKIDHKPHTNVDDVKGRKEAVQKLLEEKL